MKKNKIVWCVIEGIDYEGHLFDTLKIFSTEKLAREYASTIKDNYSKVFVEPRELH